MILGRNGAGKTTMIRLLVDRVRTALERGILRSDLWGTGLSQANATAALLP